jgi:glutamine synthetase
MMRLTVLVSLPVLACLTCAMPNDAFADELADLSAAGLRGIEKNYVLGPQAEDNVWNLTLEERRAMGYRELPSSLGVALGEMERSELVAEALGEHVFDYFLRNKRAEWEEYRSNVTPFELKQYLSL